MASIDEEMRQSRQAAEDITAQKVYYDPEGLLDSHREGFTRKDSTEEKRSKALSDIKRRITELENNKSHPKSMSGWDEAQKRWYPHKSPEGRAQTIAYGIKLSNGGKWAKTALRQGYLTDEQANAALDEEAARYYDDARRVFDRAKGAGSWDRLNHKQQSILTDYQYNVKGGLGKFPSLIDAAYRGDVEAMLKESSRKNLTARNESIARDIDSLRTHYPVTPLEKAK